MLWGIIPNFKINLNNMSFTGEYNNIIDQKNRLSIPAKYRKSLDIVNGKTFVLTKGFDQCLFLYPVEEWKTVEKQLSSLSTIKGKNRSFIRSIVRYANYESKKNILSDNDFDELANEINF